MDKNAIKKYAVWARNELIARVTQKAEQYEITEKKTTPKEADSINGRLLTNIEKRQRKALIEKINEDGFEQVMEEVAYTWFNRFTALRFMEVNNYLPSHTRLFTNEVGEFKPQILADAIQLDLEGLDMDKVFELKDANKTEELYKYLLITQCNALSAVLPRMFQKIEHYTELLLPDYLLREGSVIEQMIALIPEEDWTDQVQIIGWLYQYYNSELKDKVFADLKKNIKITKDNIPAATQLFTPDWIVHYLVENSLGRLWLEGHPNDALKSEWKYYLDEAEQEPEVQAQLITVRKEYAALKPEEIRVIDPCMGSGHILCVLFDVLIRIYEDYGYTAREATVKIVENNLWGLDIDERAAQMSYFAVMMKARQYDRRFFTRKVQPHVYAIEESNGITFASMHDMGLNLSQEEYNVAAKQVMRLVEEMHDAKEYGSILQATPCDWDLLRRFAVPREEEGQLHLDIHGESEASARLQVLINIGETLSQKYHVVVTNPPYMGSSGMCNSLAEYIKKKYPDTKNDLSTVCMEKFLLMTSEIGYMAMINIPVWMFLSSYEKLRSSLLRCNTLINMIHPGRGIFGADFGTTTFVVAKKYYRNYCGTYRRLFDKQSEVATIEAREKAFFDGKGEFISKQDSFFKIPGAPLAYWVSEKFLSLYSGKNFNDYYSFKRGIGTGNNDAYLRLWFEVPYAEHEGPKWFAYNKGGEYRKWYGNRDYVVNWENDGFAIRHNYKNGRLASRPQNTQYNLMENISYSSLTIGALSFRHYKGFINDQAGNFFISNSTVSPFVALALLNSVVAPYCISLKNSTLNTTAEDFKAIPYIGLSEEVESRVINLAEECENISKQDWDAFETSWDFQKHPLIGRGNSIEEAFVQWSDECDDRFNNLKTDEEEINRIFITLYDLQEELTPEVEDSAITIRKADVKRDVKSLISYAVGCMFGRYSLDKLGLAYSGGEWNDLAYKSFLPDKDAILPICDDEYFEDDIVGRFVKFIEIVYGKELLEENLRYIADALGGKGSSRDVIRNYFLNDFYADHCTTYSVTGSGKRPIYWLFDSGKKNGFKCLIYMHRYQPDTIARIRTDYVHEQQSRYRTAIADLEQRTNGASTSERVKLSKQLATLQAQAEEIRVYEEKIHHLADQMISIDLDDGVKHNYEIFKDVLAKIK
ncbi:MAG: BREX-1 system adenine-specific DNA-methyltransferase PglX [Clostridia bacterium]|nr:BREX-1 system adenine-specific DNA-methyltransferase PglX [Clostridia bacterium]